MGKIYLDRHEFHNEMAKCKKNGELSKKAIEMLQKFCTEASRDFYFEYPEDQEDAIMQAMHDCLKYWKNFKESNVVQLKFRRNFHIGDRIKIWISNHNNEVMEYVPCEVSNVIFREFAIDLSNGKKDSFAINRSLSNLSSVLGTRDGLILDMFIDKVKSKITLMDKFNGDTHSVNSYVEIIDYDPTNPLIEIDKKQQKQAEKINQNAKNRCYFTPPPNGFSYFTSIIRNGCLKSINKVNPKPLRNGNKLSLSMVNSENNGLYNF